MDDPDWGKSGLHRPSEHHLKPSLPTFSIGRDGIGTRDGAATEYGLEAEPQLTASGVAAAFLQEAAKRLFR